MTEEKQMLKNTKDETVLGYFIDSFYRVFRIGIYYPVGHVVLDQAASKCIQQLREISVGAKNTRISIDKENIYVDEQQIPDNHKSGKDLHKILDSLGIVAVELERTIIHKELLRFVKSVLNWRMQLEGAKSLITFQVDELPSTVHVEQQEFVVDEAAIDTGESVENPEEKLNDLCASLSDQGLTQQQVGQCRELLLSLSRVSAEKKLDLKGFPNATWQDVEALLYQIVTGAYSTESKQFKSVAKSDINVISSIFQSLERGLIDPKSKETIQFLVSHLSGRKEIKEEATSDQAIAMRKTLRRYNAEKLSISTIKEFVYENNIPVSVLGRLTASDRSEELSIYLQLLVTCRKKDLLSEILSKIKKIVVTDCNEREKEVLIAGIKFVADYSSIELFNTVFKMVLRALRETGSGRSLGFIVEFWTKMPYTTHILLWPYVVNELLVVGMEENRESFFETLEIASHMHSDGMKSMKTQLESMDGFNETPMAEICFRSSYIYSYPLYAFLFETCIGDTLSVRVLEALKEAPQDNLMEAVAPLLDLEKPKHLQFLHNYLMQAHQKEPPLALKMAGGEIILEYLQNITEEEKQNEFLEKTILATASFYTKGMKDMLESIVKDKKIAVIPIWPKNCRKAANSALKALKKVKVSELL